MFRDELPWLIGLFVVVVLTAAAVNFVLRNTGLSERIAARRSS